MAFCGTRATAEIFVLFGARLRFVLQKGDFHAHIRKDARIFRRVIKLLVIGFGDGDANLYSGLLAIGRGDHGADLGGNGPVRISIENRVDGLVVMTLAIYASLTSTSNSLE